MAFTEINSVKWDVLIAGGGNAGLCAAIAARAKGASVCVVDAAPQFYRGGNTRHTRNFRVTHAAQDEALTGSYTEQEFFDDLLLVTEGDTDRDLAQITVANSNDLYHFYRANGVAFQPALAGTLSLSKSNAFFLGGGRAMLNALYRAAERLGVKVAYETEITDIQIAGNSFRSATATRGSAKHKIAAKSFVAASGGFESNIEWLEDIWGPSARNFTIRGTPHNRGRLLELLFASGARKAGDARQFHAVAVDARGPKFDGGIVTRLDCVPFGIVVDNNANRFYDEGEDLWPKRYAIWGRLIAEAPDQLAFVIFDATVKSRFMPPLYPPYSADSVELLAKTIGLEPEKLKRTVSEFNQNVVAGDFNPSILDDCHTSNLSPPKSHWATRIETPPYFAYPLRPGITFTYLGVAVDRFAKVRTSSGLPYVNVFAAGETMAGNILQKGYIAGIGMTIGGVFGRIAGTGAANHAFG